MFSADSWGQIRAWNYSDENSEAVWSIEDAHEGWVRDLSVSADGKLLASCGRDRKVKIWSATDGKLQHEFSDHERDVYCVQFHPDGKSLVSGDERANVYFWDLEKGNRAREFDASPLYLLHRLQDVGGARVLAFDADGKTLAVGGTKPKNGGNVQGVPTVLLFDFETGELKHDLELGATSQVYVHDIDFHEAGFIMCVTSGSPGSGQLVFRRPEDKEPFFLYTKMANCHALSMHPDRQRFAVTATNKGSNGNGRRLTKDGEYLGGAIAPGLGISADALVRRTAKLPKVELTLPESAIGWNTVSAMQSGLVLGYLGLVNELVERLAKRSPRGETSSASGTSR